MRPVERLFVVAIALSAFLLFLVQPIIAKQLLPWFGGSSAVWITCLVFFQVMLLAGYTYAHFMTTCLRPRWQGSLHIAMLLIAYKTGALQVRDRRWGSMTEQHLSAK